MTDVSSGGRDPDDLAAVLRRSPLFSSIGSHELEAFVQRTTVVTFEPGDTLLTQGERREEAFLIIAGSVDLLYAVGGERIHMATIGRDQIVGEVAALGDGRQAATVVAREPVEAARLRKVDFVLAIARNPELAVALIDALARRVQRMAEPLAILTHAVTALERGTYDPEMLASFAPQSDDIGTFARAFKAMAREITEKHRQRQDLEAAHRIQQAILPGPLPAGDRAFDLYATMRPARNVGGDFFDYFELAQNRIGFVVADVSGKGIPAAIFMALSRTVIHHLAGGGDPPAECLARANDLLAEGNDAAMFVTVLYAVLDAASGELSWCNAGHTPPLLRRTDGRVEPLENRPETAIGLFAGLPYQTHTTRLAPGETVLLYTDGVTEAFDPALEAFGDARLYEALVAIEDGPRGAVERIVATVDEFAAGAEQSDDICVLAVRRLPA